MTPTSRHYDNVPLTLLQPHADYQGRWQGSTDDDRRLVQSVQQFGILVPLVVEADTYHIVKGHRRYGAATAAGLSSVPCVLHARITDGEYETLRFFLQETWKPLTQHERQRLCRRLNTHGIEVTDNLLLAA